VYRFRISNKIFKGPTKEVEILVDSGSLACSEFGDMHENGVWALLKIKCTL
jgi:hypothetical protein